MNSQNMYSNYDTRNYTQPRQRMSKPFCKVCYQAGCSPEQYNSHYVRENPAPTSKVVCPTLLSLKCNYCKNTGHTISHCTLLAEKKKCNSRDGLKKHVLDERYKRINIGDIGDINNYQQYPMIGRHQTAQTQTMVTVTTAPVIHDNELYGMTQEQIEETLQEEEMLDDIERMMKEDEIHHERAENPHHYLSPHSQYPTYYDNIPLYRQDDSFVPIQENHTDYYQPTAVCGDDTDYARKRRRIVIPTATKYSSAMDNYIETNFNQQEVNNLNYDFQMDVDDQEVDDRMEVDDQEVDDRMEVDDLMEVDLQLDDDLMEVDDNGSVS